MFLFDSNQKRIAMKKQRKSKSKKSNDSAEAKAIAKANKIKQDDMDALQITFYEIESWIEKTTPILNKMTQELDRVSHHFNKPEKDMLMNVPIKSTEISIDNNQRSNLLSSDLKSMKWSLSFNPNNSMRLETNIKSVEELIDAVKKIKLLTGHNEQDIALDDINDYIIPSPSSSTSYQLDEDEDFNTYLSSDSSDGSVIADTSIEYWNTAIYRRPDTCLEKFRKGEMDLSRLTEIVSSTKFNYICQVYWDCLHPKFASDWKSFSNRSDDPHRNQVCIDSGLAMIFLHIIRHDRSACEDALSIAYYYYNRARESLMDFFDSPDLSTIETLLNLSLFSALCKSNSQSYTYLSMAYRMIHQLGIGKLQHLPTHDPTLRKRILQIHSVLFYNDMLVSVYSGEPSMVDESTLDIDFYEILDLNQTSLEDHKTIAKETFSVHLLELTRIGKRIELMTQEYQRQNLQYHHNGTLPSRWAKRIQELEIALATWFEHLPPLYRVDDPDYVFTSTGKHHPDHDALNEQAGLLLMIQYQTQWIMLHKTFLSPHFHHSPSDRDDHGMPYRTPRSYSITMDAAYRIVTMAETITERFGWCVCQQFINCVYQASIVCCKSILNRDPNEYHSQGLIHRIMSILDSSKIHYHGLPDDLRVCLDEFLAENPILNIHEGILDQMKARDDMFNSPKMYLACLNQPLFHKSPLTFHKESLASEAIYSIKLQNPTGVVPIDLDPPSNKNWRCKFSSSNVAQMNHRIM